MPLSSKGPHEKNSWFSWIDICCDFNEFEDKNYIKLIYDNYKGLYKKWEAKSLQSYSVFVYHYY